MVKQKKYDLRIDMKNKDQYTEIKDIKWLSEEESYLKVRDYDLKKEKYYKEFLISLKIIMNMLS